VPPTPVATPSRTALVPSDAATADAAQAADATRRRSAVMCPERELPPVTDDVLVSLQRDGCYGRCPVYQLLVYRDGRVQFTGIAYVEQCEATARLDANTLAELASMFERMKFSALKAEYLHYDATDHSGATTTFQPARGRTRKTVQHYHGDSSAPKRLAEIEHEIDRIVGTAEWVHGDRNPLRDD
jgi:hypothetical protein